MAIDSPSDRASMLNFGDGSNLHLLPPPDGTISVRDRVHLLDCYAGVPFTGGDTLNLRLKLGEVELLVSGAVAIPAAGSEDVVWEFTAFFIVTKIGVPAQPLGKVRSSGSYNNGKTSGLLQSIDDVDTTVDNVLAVSAQWGTATNSITALNVLIEQVTPTDHTVTLAL